MFTVTRLPQLPGPRTAPSVGWSPVQAHVHRETSCNLVTDFVLPGLETLPCLRPSLRPQVYHMTPRAWGWLSPGLWLALSERLHHTETSSLWKVCWTLHETQKCPCGKQQGFTVQRPSDGPSTPRKALDGMDLCGTSGGRLSSRLERMSPHQPQTALGAGLTYG